MQAALECRQCGGVLQPEEGQKVVYCKFCGSANIISFADRFGLYNRANYLRRQNEFDRAISLYEDIIKEDPTDAEAYFGMTLCKYGIEYVNDPKTGNMIPTCHRTRFTLVSEDADFKKALEYADSDSRKVYLDEAEKIDSILKKIQRLSFDQDKYDVFICYKEGDGIGGRTEASVLAQDIYEDLTSRGYKVFFARKTLENKLGSDYEPIIFSALFSAKVMLVCGTEPEHFQAVWVRNEWVRFIERMSNGDECTLIPLYKGISPYDLPNEMSRIQGLDMSKIGFRQDLRDAIGRLVRRGNPVGGAAPSKEAVNPEGLRKRAYLFLENGDFNSAYEYFNKALDADPENSDCYWGRLLASLNCRTESELETVNVRISGLQDYEMALRFANDEQAEKYKRYSDFIDTKLYEEQKRREEEEEKSRKRKKTLLEERKHIVDNLGSINKECFINLYPSIVFSVITVIISVFMVRLAIPSLITYVGTTKERNDYINSEKEKEKTAQAYEDFKGWFYDNEEEITENIKNELLQKDFAVAATNVFPAISILVTDGKVKVYNCGMLSDEFVINMDDYVEVEASHHYCGIRYNTQIDIGGKDKAELICEIVDKDMNHEYEIIIGGGYRWESLEPCELEKDKDNHRCFIYDDAFIFDMDKNSVYKKED